MSGEKSPGKNGEAAGCGGPDPKTPTKCGYFNCDEMLEKVLLSWVPSALTVAIIAMEMPAAIRPYSIAVAPD